MCIQVHERRAYWRVQRAVRPEEAAFGAVLRLLQRPLLVLLGCLLVYERPPKVCQRAAEVGVRVRGHGLLYLAGVRARVDLRLQPLDEWNLVAPEAQLAE